MLQCFEFWSHGARPDSKNTPIYYLQFVSEATQAQKVWCNAIMQSFPNDATYFLATFPLLCHTCMNLRCLTCSVTAHCWITADLTKEFVYLSFFSTTSIAGRDYKESKVRFSVFFLESSCSLVDGICNVLEKIITIFQQRLVSFERTRNLSGTHLSPDMHFIEFIFVETKELSESRYVFICGKHATSAHPWLRAANAERSQIVSSCEFAIKFLISKCKGELRCRSVHDIAPWKWRIRAQCSDLRYKQYSPQYLAYMHACNIHAHTCYSVYT